MKSSSPGWSKGSAGILKQFLESATGQLFLDNLAHARPSLAAGSDLNTVALQAKAVGGYESALAQILALTEPPVEVDGEQTSELYPPIEQDALWSDGEKTAP